MKTKSQNDHVAIVSRKALAERLSMPVATVDRAISRLVAKHSIRNVQWTNGRANSRRLLTPAEAEAWGVKRLTHTKGRVPKHES